MAYPNPKMERVTNGKQTRLVTTDDFLKTAEQQSGKKLDWFFELYLRQPQLPKLIVENSNTEGGNSVNLRWETPNNMSFPMPVEVKIGETIKRIEMPNGKNWFPLQAGQKYKIDPNGWLLKAQ